MRVLLFALFLISPAFALEGWLKQSTVANVTVTMRDSSSVLVGKTGLTLTIYASKAGSTPALITPAVIELSAGNTPGLYKLTLTASHTDTVGELRLYITGAGAIMNDPVYQVSASLLDDAATAQDVADKVWDTTTSLHVIAGSFGELLGVDTQSKLFDALDLLTDIRKYIRADQRISGTTPRRLTIYEEGTTTTLDTKTLLQINGSAWTGPTQMIGGKIKTE